MNRALLLLLVALTGCQLLPMRREKELTLRSSDVLNANQATTLQRMTEGQRGSEPKISMSGKNNRLDVKLESAPVPPIEKIELSSDSKQRGGSVFNSSYSFAQALPWGVALLLFAVAIVAIIKAYKYAKAQVPAIGMAFNTAEEIVARRVGAWRDRAIVESDPVKVADSAAKIAELQRDLADLKQAKFDQTP